MVKNLSKTILPRVMLLLITLFICLFAFACNNLINAATGPKVIINGEATILVGEEFQATAMVEPADKYEQIVVWSSTDSSIVSISETGLVTGLTTGRVTIKATYKDDNYSVTGRFSVKVVKSGELYTDETPTSIKLICPTTVYSKSIKMLRIETIPENANHDVIYSVSNTNATIDTFGIISFNNVGTVKITITHKNNANIKDEVEVTILEHTKSSDIEQMTIDCINNTKNSILGVGNYIYNDNNILVLSSQGSGFVYDGYGLLENGTKTYNLTDTNIKTYHYYLITNRHVVKDSDSLKIYIHMIDELVPANLIQYDDKVDLAVVEFEYSEYITPLEIGNSDLVVAGQYAIAIGNPEGFEYSSSATHGIISHPLRYISSDTDGDSVNDWDAAYIQHDVAINPGNSGGPLLNLFGQVIGINTMKFATTDIDNMGFSIPSNDVLDLLPYLEKGKVPVRARIGVTVIEVKNLLLTDYTNNQEYKYIIPEGCTYGLYVTAVSEGSVAYNKLFADDIIIEFNNVVLKSSLELRAELGSIVVGSNTEILVKVLRNGKETTVTLIW